MVVRAYRSLLVFRASNEMKESLGLVVPSCVDNFSICLSIVLVSYDKHTSNSVFNLKIYYEK
jgi:hypothetical protein